MNNLNIKTNFTCKKPPLHPNTPTGLRIKKKELETKLKKIKILAIFQIFLIYNLND